LKLSKRRGLVAAATVRTIAPIVVGLAVLTILHAVDPERYEPAGGFENLQGSLELLSQIGMVAAVLVGATAGAGDRGAGVFRELVVTGRSRLQLFAARIPGGLAFLLPPVALSFAIAAIVSVTLAGSGQEPVTATTIARYAGWVVLVMVTAFLLALGVSSALGSRGTSIGILLAWQLAAAPLLMSTGKLDDVLPNAALASLQPEPTQIVSTSFSMAIVVLFTWTLLPLAAGAWRTSTADA
jgi:hypothetical protein